MWRAYASLAEPENRRAFVRTLRAVIDPGGQSVSARDRLYLAAGVPTLIMWGDEDPIIPVAHAHAAHEAIPGSRLEIFAGAGHFLHVEEPVRFAEVLTDFVESTAAASGESEPGANEGEPDADCGISAGDPDFGALQLQRAESGMP
jgi:pimeloyl-ACP methyl ester carboxylesterase